MLMHEEYENEGMFAWYGDRKPHMHILLLILVILKFKSWRFLFI
jgi:hypothetical protein